MKPLSPLKFFKENKRKALISFLVLIFTVCAISLITVLINSLTDTVVSTNLKPLENFSGVYPVNGEFYVKDSITDKLRKDQSIEKLIPCDFDFTTVKLAIGGNTSVPVVFSDQSSHDYIMEKLGDSLREGRLPESGTNEVAVHWRVAANKKWKIGDTIGNFKDEKESLTGEYKVVGIIEGPNIIFLGAESFKEKQLKQNAKTDKPLGFLIFPKEGKRDEVNKYLRSIKKTEGGSMTYESMKELFNDIMAGLNSTILAIIIIVIFILSISVGALTYVIYIQRSDEFGILYAMGYSRKFIRRMIIKEIMSLNIISWVAGILFSFLIIFLLNKYVYNPDGNVLTMFSVNELINTLIIPLMVGFFSIIPIILRLVKWDPVAIIERRE